MKSIIVGGIEISVEKKGIKHMYLRVKPPDGSVKLTAPRLVRDELLRAFVEAKLPWIKKQQAAFLQRPRLESGGGVEFLELWGRSYPMETIHGGGKNGVLLSEQSAALRVREGSTPQQCAAALNSWYRLELKAAIPPILERCQQRVGVAADEWHIKDMRTRWGTCNVAKRRVWLNLQLVKKPPECLEYVIMHELVHLLEPSHNHIFKGYMDRFLPDWRMIRKRLNLGDRGPSVESGAPGNRKDLDAE
ncbi:MAG: putative metal-dependent hydrolase [Oscillospiraceae bacterium]|nr:putative metal-dependent hydrolase [Oscillospiraceae bacterium]